MIDAIAVSARAAAAVEAHHLAAIAELTRRNRDRVDQGRITEGAELLRCVGLNLIHDLTLYPGSDKSDQRENTR